MKKVELEQHCYEYNCLIADARAAEDAGHHADAVRAAVASFEYIAGLLSYVHKFEGRDVVSVEGIDIVLKNSPPLLDFESLDRLDELLKNKRRIQRDTSADLVDALAQAREEMRDAHKVFDHLERHSDATPDELRSAFGGKAKRWRELVEKLEAIGVVRRVLDGGSYRVALTTRLDEPTSAKCPSCGIVGRAAKWKLFKPLACPKCRVTAHFVILKQADRTSAQ